VILTIDLRVIVIGATTHEWDHHCGITSCVSLEVSTQSSD